MGSRSAGETIANIFVAFLEQRTWSQSELARRCNLGVRALRTRLLDLQQSRMPLTSDVDHPHVYWSVPRGWYPNARVLEPSQVALVARLLGRLPRAQETARALRFVLGTDEPLPPRRPGEERATQVLATLEDAVEQRRVADIDYYTATRGDRSRRQISPHRIFYGERPRVLATCHRSGELKYFRLDEILHAELTTNASPRKVSSGELEAFLATSLDGYRAPRAAVTCSFTVRSPEARWVRRNLPPGPIEADASRDGLRFTTKTSAIDPLARFVVGLGAAAHPETPELRARVEALALGALQHLRPPRKVNTRSVRSKRAAD